MSKNIYVRWLGAFGHSTSLSSSFEYELEICDREVAAEMIDLGNWCANIEHARVGLIMDRSAVHKVFPGDVWSVSSNRSRRLQTTQYGVRHSHSHTECFCDPSYAGIVVRGAWEDLSQAARTQILQASARYDLPIYTLHHKCEEYIWELKIFRRGRRR